METTMTKDLAMSAVREICARPWRSANTAHAGTFGSCLLYTSPSPRD